MRQYLSNVEGKRISLSTLQGKPSYSEQEDLAASQATVDSTLSLEPETIPKMVGDRSLFE